MPARLRASRQRLQGELATIHDRLEGGVESDLAAERRARRWRALFLLGVLATLTCTGLAAATIALPEHGSRSRLAFGGLGVAVATALVGAIGNRFARRHDLDDRKLASATELVASLLEGIATQADEPGVRARLEIDLGRSLDRGKRESRRTQRSIDWGERKRHRKDVYVHPWLVVHLSYPDGSRARLELTDRVQRDERRTTSSDGYGDDRRTYTTRTVHESHCRSGRASVTVLPEPLHDPPATIAARLVAERRPWGVSTDPTVEGRTISLAIEPEMDATHAHDGAGKWSADYRLVDGRTLASALRWLRGGLAPSSG